MTGGGASAASSSGLPPNGSCSPETASGGCYRRGELCPTADHGMTGTDASGTPITCEQNNGWRWE